MIVLHTKSRDSKTPLHSGTWPVPHSPLARVRVQSGVATGEGMIVGRSYGKTTLYDIRLDSGTMLINLHPSLFVVTREPSAAELASILHLEPYHAIQGGQGDEPVSQQGRRAEGPWAEGWEGKLYHIARKDPRIAEALLERQADPDVEGIEQPSDAARPDLAGAPDLPDEAAEQRGGGGLQDGHGKD